MLSATAANCADLGGLPRSAFLGTQLAPAGEGSVQPVVRGVIPQSTAAALKLHPADVLVEINGAATPDVPSAVAAAGRLKAGQPIKIEIKRGGQALTLEGRAIGKPLESYPNVNVTYGSFAFQGGKVRDILAMPAGVPNAPVVFLLPGFSCVSIEPPSAGHAYRVLAARLTAAKIGFYRAEKPGMGDSLGGPQCADITFQTELDSFRAAYRHLTDTLHIRADRIVMLGHSLGALEAPLLADERAPRGIAVYGAVLRNWADYHQQLASVQRFLIDGTDPGKNYAEGEQVRPLFEAYYFEHKSPDQIAREQPGQARALKDALGWDGGERVIGRNWRFMQALSGLNLPAAWRHARSNVLSLYGGADVVALFDTDQKLIADIAEFTRPGSGTYIEVPDADHGMTRTGTRVQARADTIAERQVTPPFNEDVAKALIGWVETIMAKPPVS